MRAHQTESFETEWKSAGHIPYAQAHEHIAIVFRVGLAREHLPIKWLRIASVGGSVQPHRDSHSRSCARRDYLD